MCFARSVGCARHSLHTATGSAARGGRCRSGPAPCLQDAPRRARVGRAHGHMRLPRVQRSADGAHARSLGCAQEPVLCGDCRDVVRRGSLRSAGPLSGQCREFTELSVDTAPQLLQPSPACRGDGFGGSAVSVLTSHSPASGPAVSSALVAYSTKSFF